MFEFRPTHTLTLRGRRQRSLEIQFSHTNIETGVFYFWTKGGEYSSAHNDDIVYMRPLNQGAPG